MAPPNIPTYQSFLLSSIPFRRKSSTASSTASTASSPSTTEVPSFLAGHASVISCSRCHAELALTSQIVSKGFTGRHGRAYLVSPRPSAGTYTTLTNIEPNATGTELPNTLTHKPVARHLVTGMHTVCDVSCALCGSILGWKYVGADDEGQRYKIGKFILESRRTLVGSSWEGANVLGLQSLEEDAADFSDLTGLDHQDDDIVFDSQDEDECEDLFSGIWSPELAKRRRRRKELRE